MSHDAGPAVSRLEAGPPAAGGATDAAERRSTLRDRIASRRRIYLLRHGEVSYFDALGRPHPQDGVPLNDRGLLQAQAAAELLREVPIDLAVHTGLPRTRATAQIVLGHRTISPQEHAHLREIQPGPLALAPSGPEFERYFTGAFEAALTREACFLGGESYGSFEDRVVPAFRSLLEIPGWKHLLLVAHGGTNRVILRHALGAGLEALASLEQEAGCINMIDVLESGRLLVRQLNYTPYAPLKLGLWSTTLEQIYLEHFDGVTAARARTVARGVEPGEELKP